MATSVGRGGLDDLPQKKNWKEFAKMLAWRFFQFFIVFLVVLFVVWSLSKVVMWAYHKTFGDSQETPVTINTRLFDLEKKMPEITRQAAQAEQDSKTALENSKEAVHLANTASAAAANCNNCNGEPKKGTDKTPQPKGSAVGKTGQVAPVVVATAGKPRGVHKRTNYVTNRDACRLLVDEVVQETMYRESEADCIVWQQRRAAELGLVVATASQTGSIATVATQKSGASGKETCNLRVNGQVVNTTTRDTKAECDLWQQQEARDRGLAPK